MNYKMIAVGLAAALPLLSQSANLVSNGDFETGSGHTFDTTTNWFNRGTGGQTARARNDNITLPGSNWAAQITDQYNDFDAGGEFVSGEFGPIAHSQNTEHTIQADEFYSLSYDWRDALDWQPRDVVRFVFFATNNNTLGGDVVWSSVLDSDERQVVGEWESVSQNSSVVTSAAVGQNLFINFFGVDTLAEGAAGPTGFARVDNISVTAIPEPGTLVLFGLSGLAMMAFLRKPRK